MISFRGLLLGALSSVLVLSAQTTEQDGDWSSQTVALRDTREAERVIRVGDIDNLGFGFEAGFDPFSGRSTNPHAFPFEPGKDDIVPTDRILVGSGYTGQDIPAGQDGYSFDHHPVDRPLKNSPIRLPLDSISGLEVRDAVLCLMVDDFQSPEFKSRFQVTFNGVRFPEMEKSINALRQTGPIGKVIYVRFTQEMLGQLKGDSLSVLIDDPTTKAGDGFAYDFAKLLVNVKAFGNLGSVSGKVVDDATGEPIAKARVEAVGFAQAASDAGGDFKVEGIPAGLTVIQAGAAGYESAQATVDVIGGEAGEQIELRLKKSAMAKFTDQEVRVGDSITLSRIQFDQNRAELRPEGRAELDKVAAFLKQNPRAEIQLSGHTSSEGTAAINRDLSFRRVMSCKAYLAAASIDPARITTAGHGPDKPVAPNNNEANRALNRRVEMSFTRL